MKNSGSSQRYSRYTRLPGSHPSPSPLQSFSLFFVLLLETSEAVFGNFFSGSYQKNEKADRMKVLRICSPKRKSFSSGKG